MKKDLSTPRVQSLRDRLREQGLVRRDVWIMPEHSEALKDVEQYLRQPADVKYYMTGRRGMTIRVNKGNEG